MCCVRAGIFVVVGVCVRVCMRVGCVCVRASLYTCMHVQWCVCMCVCVCVLSCVFSYVIHSGTLNLYHNILLLHKGTKHTQGRTAVLPLSFYIVDTFE